MSDNWFNCDLSDLTEPPLRYCRQPENTKYDQPEHRRVRIAILDTGLDTLHPYIMQRLDGSEATSPGSLIWQTKEIPAAAVRSRLL